MDDQAFLNAIYDLIAQNPIAGVYGMSGAEHDYLTDLVDHVDTERNVIRFVNPRNGRGFELQLVKTYAPSEAVAKEEEL